MIAVWVAPCQKVPNDLSHCHTKKKAAAVIFVFFRNFFFFFFSFFEKSLSYQKKDGRTLGTFSGNTAVTEMRAVSCIIAVSLIFCHSKWYTCVCHYYNTIIRTTSIIIDREALAKQGDNTLGSVRPSVRPSFHLSVCAPLLEPFDHWLTQGHRWKNYHRGRAETVYRQPCPSCSRQHF